MSHDVINKTLPTAEPSASESAASFGPVDQDLPEEVFPSQPWSVETYADHLMDELFEDVERVLEGGTELPSEPAPPDYVALQTLAMPKINLSSALIPRQGSAARQRGEALDTISSETALADMAEPPEARRPFSSAFDRLLLGAAGLSVVVTAGIWLALQGGPSRWFTANTSIPQTVAPVQTAQAKADSQFINYMQRALEVIDQTGSKSKPTQVATAVKPPASAPAPAPTTNLAQAPTRIPTALERIYSPVYRPPQSLYAPPARPVLPVKPVPAPPARTALAPTALPPVAPPTVAAAPIPAITHTLLGVVEWGDRSAALFEIDGSTQRIQIGESIGASGWALVKVSNQEAVIRRNGEVRSIYVGQKF